MTPVKVLSRDTAQGHMDPTRDLVCLTFCFTQCPVSLWVRVAYTLLLRSSFLHLFPRVLLFGFNFRCFCVLDACLELFFVLALAIEPGKDDGMHPLSRAPALFPP